MSWSKWNDWNKLTKVAKHLAENAQKQIDKVLDIQDGEAEDEMVVQSDAVSCGPEQVLPDVSGELTPNNTVENGLDTDIRSTAGSRTSSGTSGFAGSVDMRHADDIADPRKNDVYTNVEPNIHLKENQPCFETTANDFGGVANTAANLVVEEFKSVDEKFTEMPLAISQSIFSASAADLLVAAKPAGNKAEESSSTEGDNNVDCGFETLSTSHEDLSLHADDFYTKRDLSQDAGFISFTPKRPPDFLNSKETSTSIINDDNEQLVAVEDLLDAVENESEKLNDDAAIDQIESPSFLLKHETMQTLDSPAVYTVNDSYNMQPERSVITAEPGDVEVVADPILMDFPVASGWDDDQVDLDAPVDSSHGSEIVSECKRCVISDAQRLSENELQARLDLALTAVDANQAILADIKVRVVEVETKLDAVEDENRQLMRAHRQLEAIHQECLPADSRDNAKRKLNNQQHIVEQLRQEGTKLADENFKLQQLMKKMRNKTKEMEAGDEISKSTIADQLNLIESLQKQINDLRIEDKRSKSEATALRSNVAKQEKQTAAVIQELHDAKSRNMSLQTALESAFKDIASLERQHTEQHSKAQETLLANKKLQQTELRRQLDELRQTLTRERHEFSQQLQQSQHSCTRLEREQLLYREQHQRELADCQSRAEHAEALREELQHSSAVAVQPYLRQIDQLQHQLNNSATAWSDYEQSLAAKLRAAHQELNEARKRELELTEQCTALEGSVTSGETTLKKLRQEAAQFLVQLADKDRELEKAKREVAESKKSYAELEREHLHAVKELESKLKQLQQQNPYANHQNSEQNGNNNIMMTEAQPGRSIVGFTRPAETLLLSNGSSHQQQQHTTAMQSQFSTYSRASDAVTGGSAFISNNNNNDYSQIKRPSVPGSTVATPTPLSTSASVANWLLSSPDPSFIDGWSAHDSALARTFGTFSSVQTEASQLPHAAIMQYKSEIERLKTNNDKLVHELARVSTLAVEFNELATRYAELDKSCSILRAQNETLMQMYGERVEEVGELREDLSEARVAYKQQLELLTARLEAAQGRNQTAQ